MCGIAGIIHFDGKPVDVKALETMSNLVVHRGPDDMGFLLFDSKGQNKPLFSSYPFESNIKKYNGGFSHRRLAIIDLEDSGRQPMTNEDQSIWVTYNGEIYNYLELKEELLSFGHKFHSKSDTEVILHGYEQWRCDLFSHLNGMWAMAIWDDKKKELILSRDRFGIKPLYYFFDDHLLIFASEIKQILPFIIKKITINESLLFRYLTIGAMEEEDETFFNEIKQVKASHFILFKKDSSKKTTSFYQLNFNSDIGVFNNNYTDIKNRLKDLLTDSIKLRLRSDVPVGTCLSGGIDSSSIVLIASKLLPYQYKNQGRQKSFTAAYINEPDIDETIFAKKVIKKAGTDGHFIYPLSEKFWEEIDELLLFHDTPTHTPSIYPQWKVMEKVKQEGIKVVLDGQGADELLSGYLGYIPIFFAQLIKDKKWSYFFHELLTHVEIYSLFNTFNLLMVTMRNLIRKEHLPRWKLTKSYIKKDFLKNFNEFPTLIKRSNKNLQQRLYQDFFLLSLKSLLKYEDINSMRFSVEARLPFMDYRLVEFIFSLPANFKYRNGKTKWILRKAMRGIVPDKIINRIDKKGFEYPEKKWFYDKKEIIKEIIQQGKDEIKIYIKTEDLLLHLESLLKQPVGSSFIWRIINLILWEKRLKKFYN